MNAERPLPPADLDYVLEGAATLWPQLRGARIFITGGTGFFGRWLLESLLLANEKHGLGVHITVLSRDPQAFRVRAPHLADCGISWLKGSIATFTLDAVEGQRFDMVIHLATEADMLATKADPKAAADVITKGTQNALELASSTGARRFLFTSSGAVYGTQPRDMERISESYEGVPDIQDGSSIYALPGEAKRQAELLCLRAAREYGLGAVIARCFTFAGPGMPINGKFAFGNFLRDAMAGGPILIQGDGTNIRSYLYSADIAVWLWTLLLRGEPGRAYNVGSENALSLLELAHKMEKELGANGVEVLRHTVPGTVPDRYVPSTNRARQDFELREGFSIDEIVRRTAAWHRGDVKH